MKNKITPARALIRMVAILQVLLKAEGEIVPTKEIKAALDAKGLLATLRTIQRDLVLMQSVGFPMVRYGHSVTKTNGWCVIEDKSTALALTTIKEAA